MSESDPKSPCQCPNCAAPIGAGASSCWTCGHELAPSEPAHAETANGGVDQIPLVEWNEPGAPAPPPPLAPAGQSKSRSLALAGGAGVLACVTAFVVLHSLQPAASPQPVEATRPIAPAVAAAPVVESAPPPTWVGARQASWANDGSKTISFELRATSDINVWMARVRPLLVVRCLYRTTEVFVAIRSAASIEGEVGNHTVRLQIDDDSELIQRWTDSVSGQELFASDSVALARRLASAQRLRFSFTPYNAKPATAEFSVAGFEKLAALVGNTCGWKLDDSRPAQVASGLQTRRQNAR
jgi:Type VI secretion system VasI, EvfG, VC_A0118